MKSPKRKKSNVETGNLYSCHFLNELPLIKIFVFQSKFIRIGNQHLMKKSFLMINHMIEDLLICEITTTMCDENNVCCSSNELFRSPRIYVEFCSELNIQLVVNSCKYLGIEYNRDRLSKTIFLNQYDYLN